MPANHPYEPPGALAAALDNPQPRRPGWLSRGFGGLLWAVAALILSAFVAATANDYHRNYDAHTRLVIQSVFVSWSVSWSFAGYAFLKGSWRWLRWLLIASPVLVMVLGSLVVVLLSRLQS